MIQARSPGMVGEIDQWSSGVEHWVNINNIKSNDAYYATCTQGAISRSWSVSCMDFGFSIPTGATINSIYVDIYGKGNSEGRIGWISLWKAAFESILQCQDVADYTPTRVLTGVDTHIACHPVSDVLWGETWTAADINGATFGCVFEVRSDKSTVAYIDYLQIVVDYTEAVSGCMPYLECTNKNESWESLFRRMIVEQDDGTLAIRACCE